MRPTLLFFLAASVIFGSTDRWIGKEYNQNSSEQRSAGEKALSSFTLQGDEKVLDLGSGDGYLTALLAEKIPLGSVIGADISPSMVAFASARFERSNLSFRLLDAKALDYIEEFDLITSFTALHWVPEQHLVLEGVKKALRPGGRFIVEMPNYLVPELEVAVNEAMANEKWAPFFENFSTGQRYFSAPEYRDLLEEAQLKVVQIEQFFDPVYFPSRLVFQGFLRQWFPYLRALPEALKGDFLDQVVDRYLELAPADEEGALLFLNRRLRAEAVKDSCVNAFL